MALTLMTRYPRVGKSQDEAARLLQATHGVSPQRYTACATLLPTSLGVSELASARWRHLFRDQEGRLGLLGVGKGGKERGVKVRDDLFIVLCDERRRRGLPTKLDGT